MTVQEKMFAASEVIKEFKNKCSSFHSSSDPAQLFAASTGAMAVEICGLRERIAKLEAACQLMLEVTGGSRHWDGETCVALKMIENVLEGKS